MSGKAYVKCHCLKTFITNILAVSVFTLHFVLLRSVCLTLGLVPSHCFGLSATLSSFTPFSNLHSAGKQDLTCKKGNWHMQTADKCFPAGYAVSTSCLVKWVFPSEPPLHTHIQLTHIPFLWLTHLKTHSLARGSPWHHRHTTNYPLFTLLLIITLILCWATLLNECSFFKVTGPAFQKMLLRELEVELRRKITHHNICWSADKLMIRSHMSPPCCLSIQPGPHNGEMYCHVGANGPFSKEHHMTWLKQFVVAQPISIFQSGPYIVFFSFLPRVTSTIIQSNQQVPVPLFQ